MGKENSGSSLGTTGSSGSFLEKLVEILSDESNSPYICWQPSGLSFLIKDVSEFEANVLTKYFKHSNHNSFVRQLNMYNFVKTCNDANYREFHNPHFQRGRRDLMANIKRKASQPNASSSGSGAEKKPDVQYMTQRQKAIVEQQERDNERAEQAKRRRAAAQAAAQSSQHSYSTIPSPGGPGSVAGGVTWDKNLGFPQSNDLLAVGSPFDYSGSESPFTSAFRLNSTESATGEPLLLPVRRNPEGINAADEVFAFNRMNSLDPNNVAPPPVGRARSRSNSGSSQTGRGAKQRGGHPTGLPQHMNTNMATFPQDAVNRIRELETRNFLLTERFNELRSQSRTVMLLLHGFLNDIVDAENLKSGDGTPVGKQRKGDGTGSGGSSRGSPRGSDGGVPGGENLGRVTRAVASSAATALKELSPLVYQLSTGGAGKLSIDTTTTSGGSGKDEREREHSPAARALKAAGGSSGDLTDNIADRNTQDAVELIKSIRSADAKTNEGASNFVSLISSINSSAKKGEKESGNGHSLAGQPIVKQSSLPASFAPPPQPQPSPKNNSVDGNSAFGDSNGKNSGTAKGNVTGVKRELESDKGGDALAGRPLKKVATIGN